MPLPPSSVRELDDDSIALLLQAYIDQIAAPDPRFLCGAPLEALCAALYGPARCGDEDQNGEDGDADAHADQRLWKYACQTLGLIPLPRPYTSWRAAFRAGCFARASAPPHETVLEWASEYGHVDVVWMLLRNRADPNVAGDGSPQTPLVLACGGGAPAGGGPHRAIAEMLLAARADMNAAGRGHVIPQDEGAGTPLQWACQENHIEIVRMLLDANAAVDARGQGGLFEFYTPLLLSVLFTRVSYDITKLLVDANADIHARVLEDESYPNVEPPDNFTPLMVAAEGGSVDVVKLLLDRGANVNDHDDIWQSSPLIEASREGHWPVVRLLLQRGADPSYSNENGYTALIEAAASSRIYVVQILLQDAHWSGGRDIQLNHRDNDGHTALWYVDNEYPANDRQKDIARMLRAAGAEK